MKETKEPVFRTETRYTEVIQKHELVRLITGSSWVIRDAVHDYQALDTIIFFENATGSADGSEPTFSGVILRVTYSDPGLVEGKVLLTIALDRSTNSSVDATPADTEA